MLLVKQLVLIMQTCIIHALGVYVHHNSEAASD